MLDETKLRIGILALCVVVVIAAPSKCQIRHNAGANPLHVSIFGEAWVNQTLHQLTLEEKVGQMLQIEFFGDYRTLTDPNYTFVRSEIQQYHIGSVALFARMFGPNLVKGNPVQVATILNQLQHDSKLPLRAGGPLKRILLEWGRKPTRTVTLADDQKNFDSLISPLYKYMAETPSRVPLSDWFDTATGAQVGFQARSVVGGVYI